MCDVTNDLLFKIQDQIIINEMGWPNKYTQFCVDYGSDLWCELYLPEKNR